MLEYVCFLQITNLSPRINHSISAQKVRCIDSQGKQLGILSINDALQAANSIGLDLVEIQPNVSPPVCKILDYGKYKYDILEILYIIISPSFDCNLLIIIPSFTL